MFNWRWFQTLKWFQFLFLYRLIYKYKMPKTCQHLKISSTLENCGQLVWWLLPVGAISVLLIQSIFAWPGCKLNFPVGSNRLWFTERQMDEKLKQFCELQRDCVVFSDLSNCTNSFFFFFKQKNFQDGCKQHCPSEEMLVYPKSLSWSCISPASPPTQQNVLSPQGVSFLKASPKPHWDTAGSICPWWPSCVPSVLSYAISPRWHMS